MKKITGLNLALGHQARVGKDTFADYINMKYNCYIINVSEDVYKITEFIQNTLGVPVEKDPKLLQFIGTGLRYHYHDEIWLNKIIKRINEIRENDPDANIIISGMRFKNEMELFAKNNFKTVKITRKNRPIDRDPTHISETELQHANFDHYISNDGTIDEFYYAIEQLLCEL